MICHATFKDAKGDWLYPADLVEGADGKLQTAEGGAVTIGRSEKMSKSKKNTVDPKAIIDGYGADTARLFMLSDSPPDRDLEWTDSGIDGAWRYLQRLYRLAGDYNNILKNLDSDSKDEKSNPELLRKFTHLTLANVTQDVERFHFNKAIARIREHTNRLEGVLDKDIMREPKFRKAFTEAIEAVLHLIAPFLPHLAEECWSLLGHKDLIALRAWPKADAALLEDETVTVAVQVNGKLRATLTLAKNLPEDEAKAIALAHPSVAAQLDGKTVKKTVVVPNRIINVVAV